MKLLILFLGVLLVVVAACRRRAAQPELTGPVSTWKISEKWSIGQGQQDGKPIFTRFNLGLQPVVRRPEFAQQLGIAVPLKNPTADGLPTRAESEELNQIEDEIQRRFLPGNESVFAGVITTNGMREYILYTTDSQKALAKARELAHDIQHHQVQFVIHDDPTWQYFRRFAAGA